MKNGNGNALVSLASAQDLSPSRNPCYMKKFGTILPILRSSIAPKTRMNKRSTLWDLQVVKDFEDLLSYAQMSDVSPNEIVGELDLTGEDIKTVVGHRKTSFKAAFRVFLNASIKKHGLTGQLDILERNNGKNFYVVGWSV